MGKMLGLSGGLALALAIAWLSIQPFSGSQGDPPPLVVSQAPVVADGQPVPEPALPLSEHDEGFDAASGVTPSTDEKAAEARPDRQKEPLLRESVRRKLEKTGESAEAFLDEQRAKEELAEYSERSLAHAVEGLGPELFHLVVRRGTDRRSEQVDAQARELLKKLVLELGEESAREYYRQGRDQLAEAAAAGDDTFLLLAEMQRRQKASLEALDAIVPSMLTAYEIELVRLLGVPAEGDVWLDPDRIRQAAAKSR